LNKPLWFQSQIAYDYGRSIFFSVAANAATGNADIKVASNLKLDIKTEYKVNIQPGWIQQISFHQYQRLHLLSTRLTLSSLNQYTCTRLRPFTQKMKINH
jgi:hypothetical protein